MRSTSSSAAISAMRVFTGSRPTNSRSNPASTSSTPEVARAAARSTTASGSKGSGSGSATVAAGR